MSTTFFRLFFFAAFQGSIKFCWPTKISWRPHVGGLGMLIVLNSISLREQQGRKCKTRRETGTQRTRNKIRDRQICVPGSVRPTYVKESATKKGMVSPLTNCSSVRIGWLPLQCYTAKIALNRLFSLFMPPLTVNTTAALAVVLTASLGKKTLSCVQPTVDSTRIVYMLL